MSIERSFSGIRERSLSRVRRSFSFDPYLYRGSQSSLCYGDHVRRSFTPIRNCVSQANLRYADPYGNKLWLNPYGCHSLDPSQNYFRAAHRQGSSNQFTVTTHIPDDRPFRSQSKYDVYVPSGWSAPLYKYMHNFYTPPTHFLYTAPRSQNRFISDYRDSRYSVARLSHRSIDNLVDHYSLPYTPLCLSSRMYYYQADTKQGSDNQVQWRRFTADLKSPMGQTPWYRAYRGEGALRHFGGYLPRYAGFYSKATWM